MNSSHASRTWLRPALVVTAALLVVGALLLGARPASADSVLPLGGLWCGLTDDGGSIQLEISPDARFVNNVDVRAMKGSLSLREATPRLGAQIKSSKYILRQETASYVCPRSPGRHEACRRIDNTSLVRGTFEAVDSLRGSFTFVVVAGQVVKRISGQYTAWPASVAPCPGASRP